MSAAVPAETALRLERPYGHFDDEAREYVVTRPDTPLPWLNYLGQDDLFGLCTNTARRLHVLARRAAAAPHALPLQRRADRLRGPLPLRQRRRHRLEPGLEADKDAARLIRVPARARATRGSLAHTPASRSSFSSSFRPARTRRSGGRRSATGALSRRTLTLFSYVEFCFYEALNDMTNFQRTYSIGEIEVEGAAIYHATEYRERRSHYTALWLHAGDRADSTRRATCSSGVHNGLHEATVPFAGRAQGSVAHGWNPIGSHQIDLHAGARSRGDLRIRPRLRRPGRRAEVRARRSS